MRFGTRGECFDLLPKYNTKAWNTVTNLIDILLLKLFSDLYLQSTVNWEKRSGKTAQENNSFGTENNFGSQISTRLHSHLFHAMVKGSSAYSKVEVRT